MSKPKRPRDTNQLAKNIVDLTTGEVQEVNPDEGKDPAAIALGRKGGLKGGKARASKMTPGERSKAAKKAAQARWDKAAKSPSMMADENDFDSVEKPRRGVIQTPEG